MDAKIPSHLTKDQINSIFDHIDSTRDRLLFKLIYAYGLRVSELINLNIEDIDFASNTIHIMPLKKRATKDKFKQGFPLTTTIADQIQAWLSIRPQSSSVNLFVCQSYQPGRRITKAITRGQVWSLFRKYAELAGIPMPLRHPHILRHSIAVAMADNDMDIYAAQTLLRHSSHKSTAVYYTISNRKRTQVTTELHDKLGL